MIKWVNINHILSSKKCNEIIVNHYCKSDPGQKFLKEMIKWVNTNDILSSKICNKNVENHHCKSDFAQTQL